MQRLSLDTQQLIRALQEPVSLVDRLLGRRSDRSDVIRRIEAAGEAAAVFYLLPVAAGDGPDAAVAGSAVSRLLGLVPLLELVELDQMARQDVWDDLPPLTRWRQLRAADLPTLDRRPDGWAALALATFHPSGYVREAAIRLLAAVPTDQPLPFLLLRVNDWVEPVQQATRAVLEQRLPSIRPETLVDLLPLVLRMLTWGRQDHEWFVGSVYQRLQQPDAWVALTCALEAGDSPVRQVCFQLAVTSDNTVEREWVVERALADVEPSIRLIGIHSLGSPGGPWQHESPGPRDGECRRRVLAIAGGDRNGFVRRAALELVISRLPEEANRTLEECLLAPHRSIRELARYHLGQASGSFDPPGFYRQALVDPTSHRVRAALEGLSEVGSRADASSVRPFCDHPFARVREAAVLALGRLDAQEHAGDFQDALADPSPRVSHAARRILSQKTGLVDFETLQGSIARPYLAAPYAPQRASALLPAEPVDLSPCLPPRGRLAGRHRGGRRPCLPSWVVRPRLPQAHTRTDRGDPTGSGRGSIRA